MKWVWEPPLTNTDSQSSFLEAKVKWKPYIATLEFPSSGGQKKLSATVDWEFCRRKPIGGAAHSSSGLTYSSNFFC